MLITTRENNLESRKCILIKCVLVAFIVFFSCFLLFNGCGVAHAEEVQTYNSVLDSLEDDISTYTSFSYGTLYSHMANTPRITSADVYHALRIEDEHSILYEISFNQGVYTFFGYRNNSYQSIYTTDGFTHTSMCNKNVSSDSSIYLFTIFINKDSNKFFYVRHNFNAPWQTYRNFYNYQTQIGGRVDMYYGGNTWAYMTYGESCSQNISLTNATSILACGDVYYYVAEGDNLIFPDNYVDPYTEDSRLKITTINDSYGNKDLVLDFTEFGTSTNAASYTYSDLSLTYTIDDVSYTLTDIDSYIEQIGDVQGLIDIMAFIPYSSLETFTEYNNVILTNVSFTRTISSAGGSGSETFNILTNYYINKYTSESGIENIDYSADVSGTKLTQIQYDSLLEKVNFSDGYYSPLGGEGTQLNIPNGYNVLYVPITGSRTISSIINEVIDEHYLTVLLPDGNIMNDIELLSYLTSEIKSSITGITSTSDAEAIIKDMVKNNYYTNVYDIVVYYWAPDSSLGEVDVMYYYLTESGRLRGINQTLADLYKETNQIAVNTKETYNYIKLRLDDFEEKSLNKLDSIISNGNNTLLWLHTIDFDINSGFNSVVNAINNIDMPEQDNSDIINKLSDVISAINNIGSSASTNEIDTPQECIEYYRDNINTDIEDIPLQYRVAYFEGMTLDKLYTYGISSNSDTLLASTSDSQYTDQSIFIIKYFYDTILDVMNNSTMYNNLVEGINDIGDNSTYFYDMFDSDFDITVYHGFR